MVIPLAPGKSKDQGCVRTLPSFPTRRKEPNCWQHWICYKVGYLGRKGRHSKHCKHADKATRRHLLDIRIFRSVGALSDFSGRDHDLQDWIKWLNQIWWKQSADFLWTKRLDHIACNFQQIKQVFVCTEVHQDGNNHGVKVPIDSLNLSTPPKFCPVWF